MEDKRKDLKSTRQRQVIDAVLAGLSKSHPDFYYLPTIELAAEIQSHIRTPGNLQHEEHQLVQGLTRRDIQIMLGIHS